MVINKDTGTTSLTSSDVFNVNFERILRLFLVSLLLILNRYICAEVHGHCSNVFTNNFPAGNYMFKVNNKNPRTWCEICSKLKIKAPKQRNWRRSGVFNVNFEHISYLILAFLFSTLSR